MLVLDFRLKSHSTILIFNYEYGRKLHSTRWTSCNMDTDLNISVIRLKTIEGNYINFPIVQ